MVSKYCLVSLQLCASVVLSTACSSQPPVRTTLSPSAEKVVAEAVIYGGNAQGGEHVLLPVTIHGHATTLLLDLGTNDYLMLSKSFLEAVGSGSVFLDTLKFGTTEQQLIPLHNPSFPADWGVYSSPALPPVTGLIGTQVLEHYDLLFNGPARRVFVYETPTHMPAVAPTTSLGWLPAGITPSDCVPLTAERQTEDADFSFVFIVNGRAVRGVFDSGSQENAMNFPAAKMLGISKSTPHIRVLPQDSSHTYGAIGPQKVYELTGVTIGVGRRQFLGQTVHILRIPSSIPATPEFNLGLDAFKDRLLWISYSTGHICWSDPQATAVGQ